MFIEYKKIEDICSCVTSGGTPKSTKWSYYHPAEIPWLKTGEVNYSRIYNTETYISNDGLKNSSAKIIPVNSVIVAMYGQGDTAGRVAINKIPLSTNQACCNLIIDNKIANYEYVYYYLNTLYEKMVSLKNGGAQPNLNAGIIKSIEIPIPDLSMQKRISKILSNYDKLIENNKKQIKLLEEVAQRLYKEWFIDFRFPGYKSVKIFNSLPTGWKYCSILDNPIFKFIKSKVKEFEGTKRYYATADISGTNIVSKGKEILFQNKPSRASIQPIINSVWFARMSNSYKILNCYGINNHLSDDSVISSGFAGFTSCIDDYFEFVYSTIASSYFDEKKNLYATGATQVSLTNEGLKKINIILPTHDIIKKYSILIRPYIKKTELLKAQNIALYEARDRLLPKLMNGEIEV